MKRTFALTGITLAVCALAVAQDNANRVVVPARNGARPRTVEANMLRGSIVVKAGAGSDIIVELRGAGGAPNRPEPKTVDGMHRIDIPWQGGLQVQEQGDTVRVNVNPIHGGHEEDLLVTVPAGTSLKLRSTHGDITAEGVRGEIDAENTHGDITLTNVSGTVVATTTHGSMKVTMDQVDASKPISFSSMMGEIDVTLPADFKANVKLKALRGEIWTDFDMKLTGGSPITKQTSSANGRFQVMVDRTMTGTINGGGTDASFFTVNGGIKIRKKK